MHSYAVLSQTVFSALYNSLVKKQKNLFLCKAGLHKVNNLSWNQMVFSQCQLQKANFQLGSFVCHIENIY